MTLSAAIESQNVGKCPVADPQLQYIRTSCPILASTGCTKDFCQAGRAIHTDEPRVGENRALLEVELEAQEFLRDLHHEGFYGTEDAFQERTVQVLREIRAGATEGIVRVDRSIAMMGGTWTQTPKELELGVRRAWRNARKCIMRSHCEELELCDLRAIRTSKQMAEKLLLGVQEAFNRGNIQPTVFVFPPRPANSRGPMILNHQILQFAGYENTDGSIIGDPASIEVTKAALDLGWQPPSTKGRWDLLPLVTMADGDRPYVAEIPADIRRLVDIRHPQYVAEFERLDLKWVQFPALTRLGFDIGGVQYTAAPFIGWYVSCVMCPSFLMLMALRFMDAEIGVRDLADTFRYNALPDIVDALGMTKGRLNDDIEEFEDLPEYERLAMLSKAQAELNYAVHWSFLQAKVTMTDSLTASMKWCRYDDDFRNKNGFRLPADPYWLAPPQGSIIPLWHRGGAPNYQPKPMISKHVQDPVKAWRREQRRGYPAPPLSAIPDPKPESRSALTQMPQKVMPISSNLTRFNRNLTRFELYSESPLSLRTTTKEMMCPQETPRDSIAIFYCSAGTVAEKLATKLHRWCKRLVRSSPAISLSPCIKPLNKLKISDLAANSTNLLVVSSTGQGEVPRNGSVFVELCQGLLLKYSLNCRRDFKFSVFGNGDSRYSATFNGAAMKVSGLMRQLGGVPLAGGICNSDTAIQPLPLGALKAWFTKLEVSLTEKGLQWIQEPAAIAITKNKYTSAVTVSVIPIDEDVQQYDDHQQQLLSTLKDAMLVSKSIEVDTGNCRSLLLGLNIGNESFEEMSCIQLLPINSTSKVQRALSALGVQEDDALDLPLDGDSPSYSKFLTEFIDLELPFVKLDWLNSIHSAANHGLTNDFLNKHSVLEVLERLHDQTLLQPSYTSALRRAICLDMPLLRTRTYSLASSQTYTSRLAKSTTDTTNITRQISIMAKIIPGGRFSSTFLADSPLPSPLKYRIVDSICGPQLRENHLAPCIIVATGAGFGPVRAFLQWRIAAAVAAGQTLPPLRRGVSLFLGLKECDLDLTVDVLNEALALDLVDMLDVIVSNPQKHRVYDALPRCQRMIREKLVKRKGLIFVCSNKAAAEGTKAAFERVLGAHEMRELRQRYVEEVF